MEINIEEALEKNGFVITHFAGTSMLPLLDEKNDLVKVEKVDGLLQVDDMALFKRKKQYILHRVMNVKEDHYEICGDNQIEIEDVPFENILGKVTGYYKSGRYVSLEDKEYKEYLNNLERDVYKRHHYYRYHSTPQVYKDLLKLVRCVVFDEEFNDSIDYGKTLKLALYHFINAYVFPKINPDICPKDVYAEWKESYYFALQKIIVFEKERKEILAEFRKKGIKYMPFKAIITNDLYPKGHYRQFTDNDILVDKPELVHEIMINRGYRLNPGEVQLAYYKDFLNFEIHKALFEDRLNYSYFDNYLDKAIQDENDDHLYHMSNEDFYAYLICHLNKHYLNAGSGIRLYLDLYYVRKKLDINYDVALKIIEDMGLKGYHERVLDSIHLLFETKEEPSVSEMRYLFTGSAFGSRENKMNREISKRGRFGYYLYRAFPPYWEMCRKFPIIKKVVILLPFIYLYRAIRVFLLGSTRRRLKEETKILMKYDSKD